MKAIAVFNNKGGVGKTTLLCNLAAYLAIKKGLNVLVIDADPQCNASQNSLSDAQIEQLYEKGKGYTLWSFSAPIKAGKGYAKTVDFADAQNFGYKLLPGDPRMSLLEDTLSADWMTSASGDIRGLRSTLMFSKLLESCSKFDVVMFDMGPSLGALNRAVLAACDYFIVPVSIDIFSIQALKNISTSLRDWRFKLKLGLQHTVATDLGVQYRGWNLTFAGYVTQQYTFRRAATGEKRAVKAYERVESLIPPTIEKAMLRDYSEKKVSPAKYLLGSIPYFHSLVPLSQLNNKPIFELTGSDGVVGAHFAKVSEYEDVISEVARNVMRQCAIPVRGRQAS